MAGFSQFFINRPVFALVISIFIVLVGLIALPLLPVASMPDLAPPTVSVSASYPGANAEVVEESLTQLIEEQVNGVATQVKDVLARVNGVSEVTAFGSKDMGMRIWLDPGLPRTQSHGHGGGRGLA